MTCSSENFERFMDPLLIGSNHRSRHLTLVLKCCPFWGRRQEHGSSHDSPHLDTQYAGAEPSSKRSTGRSNSQQKICQYFKKSERYGLGFSVSQTRVPAQLAMLLLIGDLALLVLWLIGQATIRQQWHDSFQSNTRRSWPIISVVSIGHHMEWRTIESLTTTHLIAAFAHPQHQLTQVHATRIVGSPQLPTHFLV